MIEEKGSIKTEFSLEMKQRRGVDYEWAKDIVTNFVLDIILIDF